MKKFAWKNCREIFIEAIFLHSRKIFFLNFPYKISCHRFTWYHWLRKFPIVFQQIIYFRITMCCLHWCYTFFTGVTLELHSLNQSESSNFFMYIIKVVRVDWLENLANYKKNYNVSLFHVVCTVTVRNFCSRCDASLVCRQFAHLHLKTFCYLCTVNVIFQ